MYSRHSPLGVINYCHRGQFSLAIAMYRITAQVCNRQSRVLSNPLIRAKPRIPQLGMLQINLRGGSVPVTNLSSLTIYKKAVLRNRFYLT
jgi:hypothetical protein